MTTATTSNWTTGNNTYEVNQYGVPFTTSYDGLAGTDILSFNRLSASRFTIVTDSSTGITSVDSIAGASSTFHLRLKNIEQLWFSYGTNVITLATVTDTTAPTVSSISPANSATDVLIGASIVVTFSESIALGTGYITLKTASGTTFATYDVATSSNVSVSGSTLTINPTSDLGFNTSYVISFDSGSIKDTTGNSYTGGTNVYSFTTGLTAQGTSVADTLQGDSQNNILIGLDGIDALSGGAGADVLNGGVGTDTMDGGEGSDIYLLSLVSEHTAAEFSDTGTSGTDEVRFASTVAGTLKLFAADTGIEKVVIGTGSATTAVSTGTLALSIDASLVNNALTITGNSGANTLTGTKYADIIDGGAGVDKLIGGLGNDNYYVDLVATTGALQDAVTEATAGGTDTIYLRGSSTNTKAYTLVLAATIENMDASSTQSSLLNLSGNASNNTLVGNSASNTLAGGAGNDVLTGGSGSDCFVFNTAANATNNVDTITDFVSATDKLQFSAKIFTGLGKVLGTLTDSQFWSGSGVVAAHDATDRIIYDTHTGYLYYDADGNGTASGAVQVGLIGQSTHPTLLYTDIQIIT